MNLAVDEIQTFTPDGRELAVRWNGEWWIVRCGAAETQRHSLDAAMIGAIRADAEVTGHAHEAFSGRVYDAGWVRLAAQEIENKFDLPS